MSIDLESTLDVGFGYLGRYGMDAIISEKNKEADKRRPSSDPDVNSEEMAQLNMTKVRLS